MKITVDKLNEHITRYVQDYIIPRVKKSTTLFRLGVAKGLGLLRVDAAQLATLQAHELVDPQNNIDLDRIKAAVASGLELAGELHIESLGLTLYKPDVDKFFRLCETGTLN